MVLSKKKPLCQMLSDSNINGFNQEVARSGKADLAEADLHGLDLRKADLRNADLSGAYLRAADLRGLDLSTANLRGASIRLAQISGTLFPEALSAAEIRLSLEHGTRLRYGKSEGR